MRERMCWNSWSNIACNGHSTIICLTPVLLLAIRDVKSFHRSLAPRSIRTLLFAINRHYWRYNLWRVQLISHWSVRTCIQSISPNNASAHNRISRNIFASGRLSGCLLVVIRHLFSAFRSFSFHIHFPYYRFVCICWPSHRRQHSESKSQCHDVAIRFSDCCCFFYSCRSLIEIDKLIVRLCVPPPPPPPLVYLYDFFIIFLFLRLLHRRSHCFSFFVELNYYVRRWKQCVVAQTLTITSCYSTMYKYIFSAEKREQERVSKKNMMYEKGEPKWMGIRRKPWTLPLIFLISIILIIVFFLSLLFLHSAPLLLFASSALTPYRSHCAVLLLCICQSHVTTIIHMLLLYRYYHTTHQYAPEYYSQNMQTAVANLAMIWEFQFWPPHHCHCSKYGFNVA